MSATVEGSTIQVLTAVASFMERPVDYCSTTT